MKQKPIDRELRKLRAENKRLFNLLVHADWLIDGYVDVLGGGKEYRKYAARMAKEKSFHFEVRR